MTGWSLTITTEVAAVATTTVITTSSTPSTTGAAVTFTATVTAAGNPLTTGSVQFSDGAVPLGGPVPLNASGQAALTTSALSEGTHVIVATFSGSTGFLTSNGSLTQRIDNATTVTGSTFCNTGPIGVPASGPAQPYPSNITVSGLTGTLSKVTAALNGVSHAVPVDLDILLAGPVAGMNLVLLSDAGGTSAVTGRNVVLDDAAAASVPAPLTSGTFRPTDDDSDGADLFPAPAPIPTTATGLATFNGSAPNGTWSLWVIDDATGDAGSISGGWCVTLTTTAPTTTTVTATPNPSTFGQPVTVTAAVASGGAPVPDGTVTFTAGGSPVGGPVPLAADGTATLTTTALTVGAHPITGTYTGAAGYLESAGTLTQVVNPATTTTTLTSDASPAAQGQAVTFTATVNSHGTPVAEGTVAFAVDGTVVDPDVALDAAGTATFTYAALAPGSRTVLAQYNGTSNYLTSQATSSVTVNAQPAITLPASITVDATSSSGSVVTFTATATDPEDGALTPACSPVSGSSFPVGTTTVTCTAVDARGERASGTFTVTVRPHSPKPLPPTPVSTTLTAKSYFGLYSTTLSTSEKRTLRTLVAKIPSGAAVTAKATGMVRTGGATKADRKRALKRAQAVRSYLQELGITGEITASNKGRTQSTTKKARRVNVTITYVR